MAYYKDSEYNDTILWEYMKEDFIGWTKETQAPANKDIVREFRDFLWENGVFVPKDGGSIGNNIQEQVLDVKEEYKWTPQEIEYQEILSCVYYAEQSCLRRFGRVLQVRSVTEPMVPS